MEYSVVFDLARLEGGDLIAVGSGLSTAQASLPERERKEDGWAIRIRPNGKTVWVRKYLSNNHEKLYFIEPLKDGTYLLGGRSESEQKTGRSNGVTYIIDPTTGQSLHRKEWGERFRRSAFYDGVARPNGGYVLVGWATDLATKKDDVWVVSAEADGTEEWMRIWGDKGDDLGYRAHIEPNGNIMIFGWGTKQNAPHRSGLVLRLEPSGKVSSSKFFDVGSIGDDIFLVGKPLSHGGYLVAGEASVSQNEYRGNAWSLELDAALNKIKERYLDVRGRFLDLTIGPGNRALAVGYGVAPGEKQVDAWIAEVSPKAP